MTEITEWFQARSEDARRDPGLGPDENRAALIDLIERITSLHFLGSYFGNCACSDRSDSYPCDDLKALASYVSVVTNAALPDFLRDA